MSVSGGEIRPFRKESSPRSGVGIEPFRAPMVPQIVNLEDTSDLDAAGPFLREFQSESPAQVTRLVPRNVPEPIRVPPIVPEDSEALPARPSTALAAVSRLGWRNIAVGLLALVVCQAGFMTYWMVSRSAADVPATTGSVTVTSSPAGSPVSIDGAANGTTPLTVLLAAGSHRIEVGSGAQLRGQDLSVTGGGSASMHVELAPASPPAAAAATRAATSVPEAAASRPATANQARAAAPAVFSPGWLTITSGVPMHVIENGKLVGTSDMSRIPLSAGSHELELVNAGLGYRVLRVVHITAGQTFNVGLRSPMGSLSINALPWAEVSINGQRAGETPIANLSLPIGNHEVLFRHPEFGEQRRTVTVGVQGPVRLGVDMKTP
jgi:hypothetical protein